MGDFAEKACREPAFEGALGHTVAFGHQEAGAKHIDINARMDKDDEMVVRVANDGAPIPASASAFPARLCATTTAASNSSAVTTPKPSSNPVFGSFSVGESCLSTGYANKNY